MSAGTAQSLTSTTTRWPDDRARVRALRALEAQRLLDLIALKVMPGPGRRGDRLLHLGQVGYAVVLAARDAGRAAARRSAPRCPST